MQMTRLFTILLLTIVLLLTACGGSDAPAAPAAPVGDIAAGKTLFQQSCASCHGPNAEGMPGLGKDMTTSSFIQGLNDQELLTFIKTGRPTSDPLNTTGVDMPPKGGNPALTDTQLLDIIAFIHSVQKK